MKRRTAINPSSGDVMRPTQRSKPHGRPPTRAPKGSGLTAFPLKEKKDGKLSGTPRKTKPKDLPHNLDQMTKNQLQQLDLSRRRAMEYQVKTSIARHVKDGQDTEQAREGVAIEFKEYADEYFEKRAIILQALGKFDVVPAPRKRKAKAIAKTAPPISVYMPSMAAHTFPLVVLPTVPGNLIVSTSSVPPKTNDLAGPAAPEALDSPVSSDVTRLTGPSMTVALNPSAPSNFEELNGPPTPAAVNSSVPGRDKRLAGPRMGFFSAPRKKKVTQDFLKNVTQAPVPAPYLPSMVAHTTFFVPLKVSLIAGSNSVKSTNTTKAKTRMPRASKKPKFQFLPSMYAHTQPLLAVTNTTKAKCASKRKSQSTSMAHEVIRAELRASKKKHQGVGPLSGVSLATDRISTVASVSSLITTKNSSSQITREVALSARVNLSGEVPTPHSPLISSIATPVFQTSNLLPHTERDLERSLTDMPIPHLEPLKSIDTGNISTSHTRTPTMSRKRRRVHKIIEDTEASPPADSLVFRKKCKYMRKDLPLEPAIESHIPAVNYLPSMVAHTQPLLRYSAQDVSTPAQIRNERVTKWSADTPMTYNEQRQALGSLPDVGVFVGLNTTIKRASRGRAKKSRLLVFKSARLTELDWFVENGPMEPAFTAGQALLLAEASKNADISNPPELLKPAEILRYLQPLKPTINLESPELSKATEIQTSQEPYKPAHCVQAKSSFHPTQPKRSKGVVKLERMFAKSFGARRSSITVSKPADRVVSLDVETQRTVLHEAGSNGELHRNATGQLTPSFHNALGKELTQGAHSGNLERPSMPSAASASISTGAQDASKSDKQRSLVGNHCQQRQVHASLGASNSLNASPINDGGPLSKIVGSAIVENARKRKEPPTILSQSELIKTATAILMKKRRISLPDNHNSNSSSSVMFQESVPNNAALREQKSINPTDTTVPQSRQTGLVIQKPKAAPLPKRGALPLVAEPIVDTMLISEPTAPKTQTEIPVTTANPGVSAEADILNVSTQTDSHVDSVSTSGFQTGHTTEINISTPVEDAVDLPQDYKNSIIKGGKASKARAATAKLDPPGRVIPAGGTLNFKRKKIVLDILDKCGGVFPGDRELWYPFATAWQAQGNTSKPDEKTIKATKKALIDVGKIRQLKFSFVDKSGAVVTKNIITAADIRPTDPKVHDLQKRMIERDPKNYIPEEVEVSETLKPHDTVNIIDPAVDKQAVVQLHHISPSIKRIFERRAATAERRQERLLKQQEKADRRQAVIEAAIEEELGEPDFMIEGYQDGEVMMASERDGLVKFRARLPGTRSHIGPKSRVQRLARIGKLPRSTPFRFASLNSSTDGHTVSTHGACEKPFEQRTLPILPPDIPYDRPVRFANPLGLHSNFDFDMGFSPEEIDQEQAFPVIDRVWREFSTMILPPFAIGMARSSRPSSESLTKYSRDASLAGTDTELWCEAIANPGKIRQFKHASPLTFNQHYEQQWISTTMDPDHIFHAATGTFSTNFLVLRNARLDLWVTPPPDPSLSILPYSLYDLLCRQRDLVQPDKNIDTYFRTQRIARQALQSEFENGVDKVLDWELKTEDLCAVRSADWRFINHHMPYGHIQADYSAIDMDVMYGKNDRVSNMRQYFGRRVHGTYALSRPIKRLKSRVASAAVTFSSNLAKRRLPGLKIRRLTSIAQKASLSQPEHLEGTTHIDSDGRIVKKPRIRGIAADFGQENERRLMVAVCAIRVLTGGLNRTVDWALVARVFDPKFGEGTVLNCWRNIIRASRYQMEKMQADFQELFIQAYEKDEIPTIDFDDLENYDWNKLVDWAQERLEDPQAKILASRYWNAKKTADHLVDLSCYSEHYDLRELPESDFQDFYGRAVAQEQYTSFKRIEALNGRAFVEPLQPRLDPPIDQKDAHYLALLRTWVRANVITPAENYSPDLARQKFTSLPLPGRKLERLTNRAVRELLNTRVLMQENKGRLIPGRNYDVSDQFLKGLRKTIDAGTFKRAATFKLQLDATLTDKGNMVYSRTAADGDTLVVLNLQAHDRIKVVPRDVPMNKFGLLDGNYKTRFMDKELLNFLVEIRPTPTYVYGHPLYPLPEPPNQHLGKEEARIPIWCDIFGNLVPVMWEMVLAATMALVATRSGVVARELVRCLSPGVEEWEVEVLMEWCEGVGLVKRRGSGWVTEEWWWSCFGGVGKDDAGDKGVMEWQGGS